MRRFFVYGIWIIVAAVLAGAGGFYVGWHGALRAVPVTDLFVAVQRDAFIAALRNHSDDAGYEAALHSQLSFLDALHARDHDQWDKWSYGFSRVLTLAHLSTLVEKRDASDEAANIARDAEACNPFYLASSIRHLFAHGLLTPNPSGVPVSAVATVSRFLVRVLFRVMDREFEGRMLEFEAVLVRG